MKVDLVIDTKPAESVLVLSFFLIISLPFQVLHAVSVCNWCVLSSGMFLALLKEYF